MSSLTSCHCLSAPASDVKEDDRRQRQCASVSCPASQLTFSPTPYFATAPRFDLPRIFGPFLTRHIFTLFPGQLRAGSEKGGGRRVTW